MESSTKEKESVEPLLQQEQSGEIQLEHEVPKGEQKESGWYIFWIFFSTYFLAIGSTLGVGILALPVKIGQSGFFPLFISMTICLIVQLLIVYYVVEVMQRTSAIQRSRVRRYEISDMFLETGPDLHTMGETFLHWSARIVFDFCIITHFVVLLISYSLAGPAAYSQFITIVHMAFKPAKAIELDIRWLIPPFVIILACILIFAHKIIESIISIFSSIKGAMLVFIVILCGVVGFYTNTRWVDNFQYIGRPFLIGTVALGGAANTFPVMFQKIRQNKQTVWWFRFAALLSIFTCYVLIVLWCLFVLRVVPQTGPISLEEAEKNGEISTIPLVKVLNTAFPNLAWIGTVVDIFIMLSITVSFITIGAAYKVTLDGYVNSFKAAVQAGTSWLSYITWKHMPTVIQFSLYILSFGIIIAIAMINPKAFIVVMEVFASLTLNVGTGIFISIMVLISRTRKFHVDIPLPIPTWMVALTSVTIAYFAFAVLFDIIVEILKTQLDPLPF